MLRSVIARRLTLALLLAAVAAAVGGAVLAGSAGDEGSAPPLGVSEPAYALAAELTPAERVDQVLLIGFDGTEASEEIVAQLRRSDLGGVILDGDNFADPEQLAGLIRVLRAVALTGEGDGAEARIPPLIAVAHEGGPYRAFDALPPAESQLEIGDSGSVAEAEEWSREAGAALRELGFDLNLFPVADVAALSSPIADRAFSDDPAVAAAMTAAALRGCSEAGIGCAPLHFPGLGAASQGTDEGPATVSLDAGGLGARDLEAFRAAFAERARAVVLSHAFYAAYDPVTPGSLAEPVASGLLREELGFEGVAITDDLGAGAITAVETVPAAAVEGIRAGADLLRIDSPDRQRGVRRALIAAATAQEIPEDRLAEAAARVIELKRALGLLRLG